MRIFLIGFMGSGKSHVGKRLAHLCNIPFIDLDNEIEQQEGRTIPQIFEQNGEAAFRAIEQNALHKILKHEDAVIATGGGTPCFFDNMNWMNQYGITIYLQTPVDILVERLQSERAHRPLLQNLNDETLYTFIAEKLAAREMYYLQAGVVYQIKESNENVAKALMQEFSNIIGH
ncbi:MAG: shikimate kinase [Saprospiraceae bacterium]|nr:shikimate kinase [Saprospiraceae bacterium]